MLRISTRRLSAVLAAAALCTVAALASAPPPAHAAASGYLLMKGTGSVYTANNIVNLGVTPGTSKTWGLKIVNTGSTSQQFKIAVSDGSSNMTSTLLLGSTAVPKPYFTAPVAPGKSLALNLKISVAAGAPQAEYATFVSLRDPETNLAIDGATADANATYQTGNKRNDFYVKTGSQPYVGGSTTQFTTATALKPGNTATFLLRVRNDGGTPAATTLNDVQNFDCPGDFTVVVKQGTQDVTAAVAAGTYSTGVLAPGARKELKLTVKLKAATTCTAAYFGFTASGVDGNFTSYAHVVTGV